jgi:hypothetical protein
MVHDAISAKIAGSLAMLASRPAIDDGIDIENRAADHPADCLMTIP